MVKHSKNLKVYHKLLAVQRWLQLR